jgi:hypothetical protein
LTGRAGVVRSIKGNMGAIGIFTGSAVFRRKALHQKGMLRVPEIVE